MPVGGGPSFEKFGTCSLFERTGRAAIKLDVFRHQVSKNDLDFNSKVKAPFLQRHQFGAILADAFARLTCDLRHVVRA